MPDALTAGPACPHCQAPLPGALCNTVGLVLCPACGGSPQAAVFPALFRPIEKGAAGERIGLEGDAGCFYHPGRRAVLACEGCGRFLCALCDVPLGGQHLCPACIEGGKRKGKLTNLNRHRVLYDDIALALAVYPLVIPGFGWFLSPLTAPACLFVSFRYWKQPLGVVRQSRWRFVLAILLSLLTLVGGALLLAVAFWAARSKR